jgi:flagellar biogenesis protein FliO
MRDSYTSLRKSWRLSVLSFLSLGLCLFYFASAPRALAIDASSQLFQQSTPGTTQAGQPLALPDETSTPSPSIFGTFLRLVLALGLTAGLIFVTVWGLKLVWEKRGLAGATDETKPIKILTSSYLAPRKSIHLVEVGKRVLVLGVGNDEINRLDVITDPEEIEMIHQATQIGFPNVLERLMQREVIEKSDEETERMLAESNETVGGYVEKLKGMGRKRKNDESGKKS